MYSVLAAEYGTKDLRLCQWNAREPFQDPDSQENVGYTEYVVEVKTQERRVRSQSHPHVSDRTSLSFLFHHQCNFDYGGDQVEALRVSL